MFNLKGEPKKILEELLRKQRKKLSRFNEKEGQKLVNNTKFKISTYKLKYPKSSLKGVSTVFKSLRWDKKKIGFFHLANYILKNADKLENDFAEYIYEKDVLKEDKRFDLKKDEDNLLEKERVKIENTNKKRNATKIEEKQLLNRQVWHSIFSLPKKLENEKDIEKFNEAMREGLADMLVGYKYVFAIHNDTKNTHCHIVVKCKNDITQKQIIIQPKDLIKINKELFKKCQEKGLKLEITKEKQKEIKNTKKKEKPTKIKKLSHSYNRLKKWSKMYNKGEFEPIKTDEKTLERLKKLGLDDKNIKSFLGKIRYLQYGQ